MQFDKSQTLDLLRSQGDDDKAQKADEQLPQQVDTDRDRGVLEKLGLSPQELITKLAGAGPRRPSAGCSGARPAPS